MTVKSYPKYLINFLNSHYSMDPFEKFNHWYGKEQLKNKTNFSSACCLSTIGLDGYPNARFVSLKRASNDFFIITGPLNSMKGHEISNIPKVALTFWWSHTKKQVRIQGGVSWLIPDLADEFFQKRSRKSQIISCVSKQGYLLNEKNKFSKRINDFSKLYINKQIPRPKSWGGFLIRPTRFEFLSFSSDRYHDRLVYILNGTQWNKFYIQP
jgi:pyridoxamine 5'-phosphate oxidase